MKTTDISTGLVDKDTDMAVVVKSQVPFLLYVINEIVEIPVEHVHFSLSCCIHVLEIC